jgi:hypothetical protein
MSGMGWLFSKYIEAIMKAYGLNRRAAYVFAGKHSKGFVDSCPIKNGDAHTVVEYMERFAKEGSIEFGGMLSGEAAVAPLNIERDVRKLDDRT